MTDKQIIIDGYDVSECLFYQSNFEEDYDVKIKHFCSNWHNSCESVNNSNCYFKQLARKTQECEQKDKEINELHLIIDRLLEASGYDKYISSAEDFEDVYKDMDYKLGLIDELKQECEDLKERLERTEEDLKCQCVDCMNVKSDRYRKALEVIKEVCIEDTRTFADGTTVRYDSLDEILNIINKVKGEINE